MNATKSKGLKKGDRVYWKGDVTDRLRQIARPPLRR